MSSVKYHIVKTLEDVVTSVDDKPCTFCFVTSARGRMANAYSAHYSGITVTQHVVPIRQRK
jgi:hypothetical protein